MTIQRSLPSLLTTLSLAVWTVASPLAAESTDAKQPPPPKRTIVPKLNFPSVQFDGVLNETVWSKAGSVNFSKNDGSGAGRELTEVRLWYDHEALYLGWMCVDSDIQATFTQRDSKFWEEEVAEFFITSGELSRYYELQWNPLGGVFDAIIKNELDEAGLSKKFEGDWSFTAKNMKSGVKVQGTVANSTDKDQYWSVEVKIPFNDLSLDPPKSGEVWRANFYRFNRGKNQATDLLSWSPTMLPSFHQPSRFGYLEFR